MAALVLPSAQRQQPQQGAQLNRKSVFAAGALAIVSAGQDINYASGRPLTRGGLGYLKQGFSGGLAWSPRKSFWINTETLPAIGTQSFVEFWLGYPSSTLGNLGANGADPTFLTGSSLNNSAIVSHLGSSRSATDNWGALYNWSNAPSGQFNDAGEVLTAGKLTLLVVVRRQTGMDFWRDGRLIKSISQAPTNLAASTMVVGSFIQDTYWTSCSDAILAGRVLTPVEPTAAEIKAFFDNPWQTFQAPQRRLWVASSAPVGNAYSLPAAQGSYTITGNSIGLRAARRIIASAGAYTLAGNAAALRVARRLTAAPGAYSIVGNPANLVKGIAPRALQVAAGNYTITGNPAALRVARRLQAAPGAYAITGFAVADRVMPVVTLSVRFDTLPRNFNLKTIHFSN